MTDTATPRNEAAERQPLDAFLADAGLAFDDIPVAMKIHHDALAHERQQGREEAVREIRQRLIEEGWTEDSPDPDKGPVKFGWGFLESDLDRILDAIASPSEEQKVDQRRKFQCPHCPEWFLSSIDLFRHRNAIHPVASPSEEPTPAKENP